VSVAFQAPSKVRQLAEGAFSRCRLLKSVTLPPSVQVVGKCCFADCQAFESVIFEAGSELQEVAPDAFAQCERVIVCRFASIASFMNIKMGPELESSIYPEVPSVEADGIPPGYAAIALPECEYIQLVRT
jgi:hypothetical protein